ncbi:MAG: hypothetical protein RL434_38 [Pseudomonadota bacterium]
MKSPASRCVESRGIHRLPAVLTGVVVIPAWAAEGVDAPAGVLGWVVAGLVAAVALWRVRQLTQTLRAERRKQEALLREQAGLLATVPGLRDLVQQLTAGIASLQTATDIHRTALSEVNQSVAGAARRLGDLALVLEADASPPEVAESAASSLPEIEPALLALDAAAGGLGEKFTRLHERTDEIAQAVAALDKVSERINLLSLNAAIESEKAGDRGHGFVAIAQEIRRLADHTSATSLGIARHVARAREVVSEGVMSVERFQSEVHGGVTVVRKSMGAAQAGHTGSSQEDERITRALRDCQSTAQALRVSARALGTEDERAAERLRELARLAVQLASALQTMQAGGSGAPD